MSSGDVVKHQRIYLFRLMRKNGMGTRLFFRYYARGAMLWEI